MPTLFVLKNVPPVFFFSQAGKRGFKDAAHSVLVLKDRNPTMFGDGNTRRGRGGGGIFVYFCPYLSAFLKRVNIRQISVDSEQLEKSQRK